MRLRARAACCILVLLLPSLVGCASPTPGELLERGLGDSLPDETTLGVDRDKAIELAGEYGLQEGLEPWSVRLAGAGVRGWKWIVTNMTHKDDGSSRGGRSLQIDAETGELLEDSYWDVMP